MSKLLQFLGLSNKQADFPEDLPFLSMRKLRFDEVSLKSPDISQRNSDTFEEKDSLRPSAYLIKKIIHKPVFSKYSSPLKLICKKPISLSQSKSFTPNTHFKQQCCPLDFKNRSYSSLDAGQIKENIQEFAFADENELCAEDENYREKSMQPYNLLRREDLAELLQKNPEEIVVLDCRYGFEFEEFAKNQGGHIKSAIQLDNDPFKLLELFFFREKNAVFTEEIKEKSPENQHSPTKQLATKLDFLDFCEGNPQELSKKKIVFHCEFSQCRGPKLYNLLRSFDREINFKHYPKLTYPQIFLLEGGYSEFYQSFPEFCIGNYRKMRDKSFNFEYIRQKCESKKMWELLRTHKEKVLEALKNE